jgi:hypothetical protein
VDQPIAVAGERTTVDGTLASATVAPVAFELVECRSEPHTWKTPLTY